jgi:hypothetical protein
VLNFGALAFGLLATPRRTWRAFVRGRHSRNLYGGEFRDSLLDDSVDALQQRLGLVAPVANASTRDTAAFVGWSTFVLAWHATAVAAGAAVLYFLVRAVRHVTL